ncbi:MAG: hypothetical protein J7L88_01815 [Thermoplasmata archaeon]|nr:hypothetical protein [Thermoplasmata archaeon]
MRKASALLFCLTLASVSLLLPPSGGVPFNTDGFRQESWRVFNFGYKVIPLGDVDSDGIADFAVSDVGDDLIATNGGAVYIFFGEVGFNTSKVRREGAYVSFHGFEDNGRLGEEMVAGDFNSDGLTDILVGMRKSDGYVDIYMIDRRDMKPTIPGRQFSIEGETVVDTIYPDPTYGYSLTDIGDFNGDGTDDYALALPSAVYGRGEVRLLLSREGVQDLTYDYIFRGASGERLGIYISPAGDLDGDGRDEFIMGNLTEIMVVFYNVTTRYENLWDNDGDGVVDFTGGWNSTGNTFGLSGDDDGWDTATPPGPYGGTETAVRYMPNETESLSNVNRTIQAINMAAMEIGGGSSSGGECSGAIGVEFTLDSGESIGLVSAMLELDYYYWDYGFESDERWWIKGRVSNSLEQHYLGSNSDGDGGGDSTEEIFTLRDENNAPQSGGGHFRQEIVSFLTSPGDYYLDLGGKITKWTTFGEYLAVAFDNISLKYTNLHPLIIPITLGGMSYIGNFTSFFGEINGDGVSDTVFLSPSTGAVVIYGGREGIRNESRIDLSTYPADARVVSSTSHPVGLSGCVIPAEGYFNTSLLLLGCPTASPDGLTEAGEVVGILSENLRGRVVLTSPDYLLPGPYPGVEFGRRLYQVGDVNGDGYTDVIGFSKVVPERDESTFISLFSRTPLPPSIELKKPGAGETLSGNYTIVAVVEDPDGDISGALLRVHISQDNMSWSEVTNTTVNGSGRFEIPLNTHLIENGYWYFMANITDRYGHTSCDYTGRVRIFNPHPPRITIDYPFGGEKLSGVVSIRILMYNEDGEILPPGVKAYISPDGENWTFIGATNESSIINPNLYIIHFDTTTVDDGDYFFRANVTNEYGLSDEYTTPGNITIDNTYPPVVHILYPTPGITLSRESTIRLFITDRDNNFIPEGVKVYLGDNFTFWLPINFSSYTYKDFIFEGRYNTSDFPNGEYSVRAEVSDINGSTSEVYLNGTIRIINVYSPVIRIISPAPNSTVDGLTALKASVTDKDSNIIPTSMHFYLSQDGVVWSDLGMGILYEGVYRLDYNFTAVSNGVYFLKAAIRDGTNLTAEDIIVIHVQNHYPPEVLVLYPDGNVTLKGVVTVRIQVTDDGPLDRVVVEVYLVTPTGREIYLGTAGRVDNTTIFTLNWNTKQNPDGSYYLLKAVATDEDGLTSYDLSNASFQVANKAPTVSGEGEKKGFWEEIGPAGQLFIVFGIIFLAMIIVWMQYTIRKKRREEAEMRLEEVRRRKEREKEEKIKEEEVKESLYKVKEKLEKMPVSEERPMSAYEKDLMTGFASEEYIEEEEEIEETPFMVRRERRAEEEEEERPSPFVVEREAPEEVEERRPSRRREEEVPIWDLVPVEEDEVIWEEEEEEEKDYFYVTCKCGYNIPIPEDYTPPYRFRCPRCGRTGVIKE